MGFRQWAARLAAGVVAGALALPALAQFPDRMIRLVVPYPPGASTDVISRLVAQKMSASLKVPVIVDNRGGASGNIGSDYVAKAAPDGYTILLGTDATHSANYHLFKEMPFHPLKDFRPITLAARNIVVLAATASLPVDSAQALIDYAAKHPDLSYGSSGVGSPHHLAGELFNQQAGTHILHVPYRGGGPALVDAVSGQIPLVYASLASAEPHLKAGKLKVLGVTQQSDYEGLPAISHTLAGFDMESWLAFFAPAGVPDDVLATLHRAIVDGLRDPEVQKTLRAAGLVVVGNSPEAFAAQLQADFEKRGALIRAAHIQAE